MFGLILMQLAGDVCARLTASVSFAPLVWVCLADTVMLKRDVEVLDVVSI